MNTTLEVYARKINPQDSELYNALKELTDNLANRFDLRQIPTDANTVYKYTGTYVYDGVIADAVYDSIYDSNLVTWGEGYHNSEFFDIDRDTIVQLEYFGHGDYGGSIQGMANTDYLRTEYPELKGTFVISGAYSWQTIGITLGTLIESREALGVGDSSLWDSIIKLADYALFSDDTYYHTEERLKDEYWQNATDAYYGIVNKIETDDWFVDEDKFGMNHTRTLFEYLGELFRHGDIYGQSHYNAIDCPYIEELMHKYIEAYSLDTLRDLVKHLSEGGDIDGWRIKIEGC